MSLQGNIINIIVPKKLVSK